MTRRKYKMENIMKDLDDTIAALDKAIIAIDSDSTLDSTNSLVLAAWTSLNNVAIDVKELHSQHLAFTQNRGETK